MQIFANNLYERLQEAGREPGEHALLRQAAALFEAVQRGEDG